MLYFFRRKYFGNCDLHPADFKLESGSVQCSAVIKPGPWPVIISCKATKPQGKGQTDKNQGQLCRVNHEIGSTFEFPQI